MVKQKIVKAGISSRFTEPITTVGIINQTSFQEMQSPNMASILGYLSAPFSEYSLW